MAFFALFLQIHLSLSMKVLSATCTCPRGKFRCHHIAVAVLHAQKIIASTDAECRWIKKKCQEETKYVCRSSILHLIFFSHRLFIFFWRGTYTFRKPENLGEQLLFFAKARNCNIPIQQTHTCVDSTNTFPHCRNDGKQNQLGKH